MMFLTISKCVTKIKCIPLFIFDHKQLFFRESSLSVIPITSDNKHLIYEKGYPRQIRKGGNWKLDTKKITRNGQ